jgi:hypothetical protein
LSGTCASVPKGYVYVGSNIFNAHNGAEFGIPHFSSATGTLSEAHWGPLKYTLPRSAPAGYDLQLWVTCEVDDGYDYGVYYPARYLLVR